MQTFATWGLILNGFLLFLLLVGGFFMFRAFLRKMKPDTDRKP